MKEFWNERYSAKDYAYGTEPNIFFKQIIDKYSPKGSILLPAEGEGRNAVYAAKKGLKVYAFDISEEAQKKALQLAEKERVNIHYFLGDLNTIQFPTTKFDAIGLVFAHFPDNLREIYHHKFSEMLNSGGLIILEGFAKGNLELKKKNPKVGGPGNIDMLFSVNEIKNDFKNLETIKLKEQDVELKEGQFHIGTAKVIRYIGKKTD